VSKVQDNLVKRLYDQNANLDDIVSSEGVVLIYEINPDLNP
jgi:hypothetical protein